jgi:hypothetical protein
MELSCPFFLCKLNDAPPNSLKYLNVGPKVKQQKNKKVRARSVAHVFRGRRACWSSRMGLVWIHKWEFKMSQLAQPRKKNNWCKLNGNGAMNLKGTTSNTSFTWPVIFGRRHHFTPYNILCDSL